MLLNIPETGVIKKQSFEIKQDVSILYGFNNCGKTTILKALDQVFQNRLTVYPGTNRRIGHIYSNQPDYY